MNKKKKFIILICSILVIATGIILMFILTNSKYAELNYNENDIKKVTITIDFSVPKLEYSTKTFDVYSKNGIRTVLDSVKKIQKAEKNELKGVESPSAFYIFKYFLENGKIKEIKYKIPPNNLGDPLANIWKLDEVTKQIRPVFTIDVSQITKAVIYYNTLTDTIYKDLPISSKQYLIDAGKQIITDTNGVFNFVDTKFGINFYNSSDEIICSIPFDKETPHIDEIRRSILEIDNQLKEWGFN